MFEHSSKTKQRFDLSVVTLTRAADAQLRRGDRNTLSRGAWQIRRAVPGLSHRGGRPRHQLQRRHRMDRRADPGRAGRAISSSPEAYTYDRMVKNHLSLKTLEAHLPAINARRVVLTPMSDDMLGRVGASPTRSRATAWSSCSDGAFRSGSPAPRHRIARNNPPWTRDERRGKN